MLPVEPMPMLDGSLYVGLQSIHDSSDDNQDYFR